MNKREFTAIYQKRGKRYRAWIEEIPGVNTQGNTKKQAQENLREALLLILEANRKLSEQHNDRAHVLRELLRVGVPTRV